MVAAAGGIYIWNYAVLKRGTADLERPAMLVDRGALFEVVRHPMYLADLVWTAGLALTVGGWLATVLCAGFAAATVLTARHEDTALASRFPEAHAAWRCRTWLLVPGVW